MKNKLKRLLAGIVALIMVVPMVPKMTTMAYAEEGVEFVYCEVDEDNRERVNEHVEVCSNYETVTSDTTELGNGWYVVKDEVTVSSPIYTKGDAHLILCDDAKLFAQKGIIVNKDCTLNIYGQDKNTGYLEATGVARGKKAAIGVRGTLYIHGGTIQATAESGAGIGSYALSTDRFKVYITGGNVSAISNTGAGIGIGDGYSGMGGSVYFIDGYITAHSTSSAGIGGKGTSSSSRCDLWYDGGLFTATSTEGSAVDVSATHGYIFVEYGDDEKSASSGIGSERDLSDEIREYKYVRTECQHKKISLTEVTADYHGLKCDICGDVFPNLAHVYDYNWEADNHVCRLCEYVRDHDWHDWNEWSECTICYRICQHKTYTDGKCSACGKVCAHSYGIEGEAVYTCQTCGYVDESKKIAPVEYVSRSWNGTEVVDEVLACTSYEIVTSNLIRTVNDTWYVVNEDVIIYRMVIVGTANLILCDGCTLTVRDRITVGADATLNIYSQTGDSGKLSVSRGIGGYVEDIDCGIVTIHGGIVTSTAKSSAAAIGGAEKGNGGIVTINGGIVTATNEDSAAGIGGGLKGNGGTVTINGGTVTATGGRSGGSGIGGGMSGDGGTVTINGGTVTATGGQKGGAGIGSYRLCDGGTVTINGGTVTAVGSSNDAGIGSREKGAVVYLGENVMLECSGYDGRYGMIKATFTNAGENIGEEMRLFKSVKTYHTYGGPVWNWEKNEDGDWKLSYYHQCAICDGVTEPVDVPLTRTEDAGIITFRPTTDPVIGGTTYTGLEKTEEVEIPHVHTQEPIPAVAPTCIEDGWTAGVKCSECGEILVQQEVDPATGIHTYGEPMWNWIKSGNEDWKLSYTRKCSVCGEVSEQVEVPLTRTESAGAVTIRPTVDPVIDGVTYTDLVRTEDVTYTVTYNGTANTYHYADEVVLDAGRIVKWYANGVLMGTDRYYVFRVTQSVEITTENAAAAMPQITLGVQKDGSKAVMTAQWTTPNGCTFVKAGICRANSTNNSIANTTIYEKGTNKASSLTTPNGTYVLTANGTTGKTMRVVAYLIYRDASGEEHTLLTEVASLGF